MTIAGPANSFVNFNSATGTLTGGIYQVTGVLQLATFSQNNDIITNSAAITLTGPTAAINDQSNNNALATLATNASKGTLTITGGQGLTTRGSLTNAGTLTVAKSSTLTVAGSGSYTQTGGKTTVDGTLATSGTASFRGGSLMQTGAGSININGGAVFGNGGNLSANVVSSGTITPADSATSVGTLTVTGSYTQNSPATLDINIGGSKTGQFNVLSATGAANLGGTLNIGLLHGYVPAVGSTFQVLTASSLSGTFSSVNGTSINGSEHFTALYNSNNVTLQVVSGP
jgi:hypothetical protein